MPGEYTPTPAAQALICMRYVATAGAGIQLRKWVSGSSVLLST